MTIKQQVFTGLKWSIIAKAVTQIFSWISTFLVIRMLTPEDYGVMAIAMVLFTLISYFTTNGLTSVLIRDQGRSPALESQMFSLSLVVNIILSSLLFLLSWQLESYYRNEQVGDVVRFFAIINPLTSFLVVPTSRLQKDMNFKLKSIIEGVAAFVGALSAFTLAYLGFAVWALVLASAAMMICKVALSLYYAPPIPKVTLHLKGIADELYYAAHIQIGTLLWFVYNKVDAIILGRMLGLDKLGIYNVANDIAAIPLSKGSAILNDVGFAAFSKVASDLPLAKYYASRSIFMVALVMFPVFYGLSAISHELINVLVGEKWLEASPVISLLCLIFPLRMISSVLSNFSNALGDAKFNLHNAYVIAAVLISSIATGASFGLIGAALGWVVGYVLVYTFTIYRYMTRYQFSIKELLPYRQVFLSSSLMLLVVHFFPMARFFDNSLVLMTLKIVIGSAVSLPLLLHFHKKDILSILKKKP